MFSQQKKSPIKDEDNKTGEKINEKLFPCSYIIFFLNPSCCCFINSTKSRLAENIYSFFGVQVAVKLFSRVFGVFANQKCSLMKINKTLEQFEKLLGHFATKDNWELKGLAVLITILPNKKTIQNISENMGEIC